MITASNKLWATAGAFALAATAVLVPVSAQADEPGGTDSSANSDANATSSNVGRAAGRSAARTNRGGTSNATNGAAGSGVSTPPKSVVSGARDATGAPAANNTGSNPLFQNPLWWFGTPNPTPPPTIATRNFDALASLPGWARGYYGWYDNLDFEACVLGLSSTFSPNLGPYGTSTNSISTGGC
jgi:hypothetical protein